MLSQCADHRKYEYGQRSVYAPILIEFFVFYSVKILLFAILPGKCTDVWLGLCLPCLLSMNVGRLIGTNLCPLRAVLGHLHVYHDNVILSGTIGQTLRKW